MATITKDTREIIKLCEDLIIKCDVRIDEIKEISIKNIMEVPKGIFKKVYPTREQAEFLLNENRFWNYYSEASSLKRRIESLNDLIKLCELSSNGMITLSTEDLELFKEIK